MLGAFAGLGLVATLVAQLRRGLVRILIAVAHAFLEALHRFAKVLAGYDRGLSLCLRFRFAVLLVFFATIAVTVYQVSTIPKGFFPQEDIGQLQVTTQARPDISFDAMSALQAKVEDVFRNSPYVANVGSSVGASGQSSLLNSGRLFVELKPKTERPALATVLRDLRRQLSTIAGVQTYMSPAQNLSIGARGSASQYQLVVQSLDQDKMNEWSGKLVDAMRAEPAFFLDVNSDLQNSAPQARLVVDKDKAAALGVDTGTLRSALYGGFGSQQISTIFSASDSYDVIMELDPAIHWSPERLEQMEVPAGAGKLVPIGAFAHMEMTAGLLTVNQLGQLPAVTLSYNLPAGVPLDASMAEITRLKAEIGLPADVSTQYYGTAKTFQDSVANQGLLILAAVLTIYIVLGILYESFIHPLTILSGLPSAVSGALLAIGVSGFDLSVIAVIGLLMLIGIVKKNAIMMIDVALTLQRQGLAARDAIHKACLLRFRPIMMTTLAAIMGTLPIALGSGASSELRQPLGVAVVGGLIVSQTLTLFVTPVIYLYMEGLKDAVRRLFGGTRESAPAAALPVRIPSEP